MGKNAKTIRDCAVGQKVKLSGRIQSRAYQKKINNNEVVEKVAYEISLSKIEKQHNSEQVQGQQMEMSLFAN